MEEGNLWCCCWCCSPLSFVVSRTAQPTTTLNLGQCHRVWSGEASSDGQAGTRTRTHKKKTLVAASQSSKDICMKQLVEFACMWEVADHHRNVDNLGHLRMGRSVDSRLPYYSELQRPE